MRAAAAVRVMTERQAQAALAAAAQALQALLMGLLEQPIEAAAAALVITIIGDALAALELLFSPTHNLHHKS
jgi:hypothetical protein